MIKLAEVRSLIIGRADRITDIDEVAKVIFFESLSGTRYALDFGYIPNYTQLKAEYEIDYPEEE